jgi:hypothetical protein
VGHTHTFYVFSNIHILYITHFLPSRSPSSPPLSVPDHSSDLGPSVVHLGGDAPAARGIFRLCRRVGQDTPIQRTSQFALFLTGRTKKCSQKSRRLVVNASNGRFSFCKPPKLIRFVPFLSMIVVGLAGPGHPQVGRFHQRWRVRGLQEVRLQAGTARPNYKPINFI